jgi:hypothetical protein
MQLQHFSKLCGIAANNFHAPHKDPALLSVLKRDTYYLWFKIYSICYSFWSSQTCQMVAALHLKNLALKLHFVPTLAVYIKKKQEKSSLSKSRNLTSPSPRTTTWSSCVSSCRVSHKLNTRWPPGKAMGSNTPQIGIRDNVCNAVHRDVRVNVEMETQIFCQVWSHSWILSRYIV